MRIKRFTVIAGRYEEELAISLDALTGAVFGLSRTQATIAINKQTGAVALIRENEDWSTIAAELNTTAA